jgi:hypothetical protein
VRVFIEMDADGIGYPCFAFFDTVTDTFDVLNDSQHWESLAELLEDLRLDPAAWGNDPKYLQYDISRYRALTPVRYGGTAP